MLKKEKESKEELVALIESMLDMLPFLEKNMGDEAKIKIKMMLTWKTITAMCDLIGKVASFVANFSASSVAGKSIQS